MWDHHRRKDKVEGNEGATYYRFTHALWFHASFALLVTARGVSEVVGELDASITGTEGED